MQSQSSSTFCRVRASAGLLLSLSLTAAGSAQAPGARQVISHGGNNMVVNEPTIAAVQGLGGFPPPRTWVVIWQEQDKPAGQELDVPFELRYAIGTEQPDGSITWVEAEDPLPAPSGAFPVYEPAVAALDEDASNNDSFVGGGVGFFDDNGNIVQNVFSINSGTDLDFQDTDSIARVLGSQVRHPRFGAPRPFESGQPLHLIGQSPLETGGDLQILLNQSVDGGATWSFWTALEEDLGQPVKGLPSEIDVDPDENNAGLDLIPYFSYLLADPQTGEEFLNAGRWDPTNAFTDLGLEAALDLQIDVEVGETYHQASIDHLAGEFGIMETTSVQIFYDVPYPCQGMTVPNVYVAYHDLAAPAGAGEDGDFNIYLVKAFWNGIEYQWSERLKVNKDNGGVQSDQFMPVLLMAHPSKQMYVAYYDTRDDPQEPGDDVKIGLYFAAVAEGGDSQCAPGWTDVTIQEVQVDDVVINTEHLLNPRFIGDFMDMAFHPAPTEPTSLVITCMGTAPQPPIGVPPFGFEGQGGIPQTNENEAIFAYPVDL